MMASSLGMPSSPDATPAWGIGCVLGEMVANDWLEEDSDFAEAIENSEGGVEKFKETMQGLMIEVTKCMGKSTDFLKDPDDDDNPARNMVPN